MIYPKFPRRTLALVLFCLLITLGAVGILFLIYFFNENNALIMDISQKAHYKQNIINKLEYKDDLESKDHIAKELPEAVNQMRVDNHKRKVVATSDEDFHIPSSFSSQEFDTSNAKGTVPTKQVLDPSGSKNSISNSDTIYIDDFDKTVYNARGKADLKSIDYSDTIPIDRKNFKDDENIPNNRKLRKSSSARSRKKQNILLSDPANFDRRHNENEKKSKINSKRRSNRNRESKSKFYRYSTLKQTGCDDDEGYDLDMDPAFSGSGDFVDDNDMLVKQSDLELPRKEANSKRPFNRNNAKGHFRRKHRIFFFNDEHAMVPTPVIQTTTPPENLTAPLDGVDQRHSVPFTASGKWPLKNWLSPILNSYHQKSNLSKLDINNVNPPITRADNSDQQQFEVGEIESTAGTKPADISGTNQRATDTATNDKKDAWIETRTRRIMGNVKKSEERSRQLLLCEEAGGGELCRMLFKGYIND